MKRCVFWTIPALSLLAAVVIVVTLAAPSAEAIPAFARKYSMSCTTCHAPVPRLKEYGDEFAGNGFVLEEKEAPRYFMETGDESLDLLRDLPLAIRLEGFLQHDSRTDRDLDFSTPYNVKLLSGGSLTKNIAYYMYFFLSERGEVVGLEDAYVMFNDLLGHDLDIYIGQFQASDPLFKREVRLTYEDYQIYKTKIGFSRIALSYDRGLMVTYGHPSGFDAVLEVVNGNGIDAADEFRVYDDDQYKNGALRLSQSINDHLRLGAIGYYGKEGDPIHNEVWMAGGDATFAWANGSVNVQYLRRNDDNPAFLLDPGDEIVTQGGLAEVVFLPHGDRSRWYCAALYNRIDSDLDVYDYDTITGHIGYLVRTNIRLTLENTYDIEDEENRLVMGVITAF